jgi:hypothetical protein
MLNFSQLRTIGLHINHLVDREVNKIIRHKDVQTATEAPPTINEISYSETDSRQTSRTKRAAT